MAFQRTSNRGIKTDFIKQLTKHLKPLTKIYSIEVNSLLSQRFIRELLRSGHIGELRFVSREIPTDVLRLYADGYNEIEGTVEFSVKAKRGRRLPLNDQILRAITQGKNVSDIVQFRDLNYEYDQMKLQITEFGKEWTVDLSDFNKIRPYYSIDDSIQRGEDGHPALDAVHDFASSLVDEFRTQARTELS